MTRESPFLLVIVKVFAVASAEATLPRNGMARGVFAVAPWPWGKRSLRLPGVGDALALAKAPGRDAKRGRREADASED